MEDGQLGKKVGGTIVDVEPFVPIVLLETLNPEGRPPALCPTCSTLN